MWRCVLPLIALGLAIGCRSGFPLADFRDRSSGEESTGGSSTAKKTGGDREKPSSVIQAASSGKSVGRVVPLGDTALVGDAEQRLAGTEVVAMVNGAPVFASELLDRYRPQLELAQKQLSASDYEKTRRALIQRDLKNHIQRKLLVQALRSKLEPEQASQIDGQLDKFFGQEIERMKEDLKVGTRAELEEKLQEQGTSLAALRDEFANQQLAIEYLRSEATPQIDTSRQQLLAYYHEHEDEFVLPARVRWQQIRVSFSKHGGKKQAFQIVEQLVQQLRDGKSFDHVARRFSDGPTAKDGGHWGWTTAGSLANNDVELALFQLPVGQISQVFTEEDGFQLVRVMERQEKRVKAFEQVQNDIKKAMERRAKELARKNALDELYQSAIIESNYDVSLASHSE